MGITTSYLTDAEINELRNVEIPTPPQQRKVTDRKGFIIVGILVLILLPFLIYTLVKSDIRRLNHGHDSCGNLCGVANKKIKGVECSGKDYSNKPFEIFNVTTELRNCTDECPRRYHSADDGACHKSTDSNSTSVVPNLLTHSFQFWWKFILEIIITIILSISTLFLFRLCPKVIVWSVLSVGLLSAIILTLFFWYLYTSSSQYSTEELEYAYLGLAVISTIFTIIIIIAFIVFRKKIMLIILLYKETATAFLDMPLMIFVPVITLALQFVVVTLFLLSTALMQTGAVHVKDEIAESYTLEINGAMIFAMVMNAIVTIWALEFFTGCQYMILAGSVCQWFFKKNPVSPITASFKNTVKFHLGSVAFGAFIITLFIVIKSIIKSMIKNPRTKWLVECICENIEAFLKFLSRNAYIETALYGQPFFRSGRRAATLLIKNAGNVLAVYSVGIFVLVMTEFILLVVTTTIAYGLFWTYEYSWFATVICLMGNIIIVAVVFNVFNIIVETLVICFCEDASLYDGASMTAGFKKFVEETEKVYKTETI